MSASLNAARRARELDLLAEQEVDLLVVGGGATGAGIALDAASRGLSVALLEKHDLAYGTSRWSSKLIHGGLRYLATGQVGIAHESAVERGILMTRTAPHLVRALPTLLPAYDGSNRSVDAMVAAGLVGGDVLRRVAGTPSRVLPRPRRVGRPEALALAPGLRKEGLRGGRLYHDGQVVDDARLVVAIARTAASYGAYVITRAEVAHLTGRSAVVRDLVGGAELTVRAKAVVNAAGVWAAALAPDVRLRPSRGSHLVLRADAVGNPRAAVGVSLGGNRAGLLLPQLDGTVYVGLTDVEADDLPDVPTPSEAEVDFLLDVACRALERPVGRDDVVGAYAGLRPLLAGASGSTADLSRRHAVLTGPDGVLTVVGGKLTTYRRMAQDAVDAAVAAGGLTAGKCRTRDLPLIGAAAPEVLDRLAAPRRLVARYGAEAVRVLAGGPSDELAPGVRVTAAEVLHAVRHEGALDADDVLERRTRLGLVPVDRAAAEAAVTSLLAAATA